MRSCGEGHYSVFSFARLSSVDLRRRCVWQKAFEIRHYTDQDRALTYEQITAGVQHSRQPNSTNVKDGKSCHFLLPGHSPGGDKILAWLVSDHAELIRDRS